MSYCYFVIYIYIIYISTKKSPYDISVLKVEHFVKGPEILTKQPSLFTCFFHNMFFLGSSVVPPMNMLMLFKVQEKAPKDDGSMDGWVHHLGFTAFVASQYPP